MVPPYLGEGPDSREPQRLGDHAAGMVDKSLTADASNAHQRHRDLPIVFL
jgi:hypothetical protein